MGITVSNLDLSMAAPPAPDGSVSKYQAQLYNVTVTDADGVTTTSLTNLSIGQLVMALCLERAVAMEKEIIDRMDKLNKTSNELEGLTTIETAVLGADSTLDLSTTLPAPNAGVSYSSFLASDSINITVPSGGVNKNSADFINALEQAMDQRNSMNQRTMIDLQSSTNKRDQSYDMISNILKSLNTVLTGNANNL